jgi:hypothetical protein
MTRITYADKPYEEMTAAERHEAYLTWREEFDAGVARAIAAQVESDRELAAKYDNDPEALRAAAWAQPISMHGNAAARRFYNAAQEAQIVRQRKAEKATV